MEQLVGLVIVSHSAQIAAGTVELARQMVGDDVRIEAAGGLPDGSLGTDAASIMEAIVAADAGAGVVVLVDLGSAVLATQTAFELMGDAASRLRLSRGPLVERAVVAAVHASVDDDLAAVLAAAEEAASLPKIPE